MERSLKQGTLSIRKAKDLSKGRPKITIKVIAVQKMTQSIIQAAIEAANVAIMVIKEAENQQVLWCTELMSWH